MPCPSFCAASVKQCIPDDQIPVDVKRETWCVKVTFYVLRFTFYASRFTFLH